MSRTGIEPSPSNIGDKLAWPRTCIASDPPSYRLTVGSMDTSDPPSYRLTVGSMDTSDPPSYRLTVGSMDTRGTFILLHSFTMPVCERFVM